MLPGLVGQVRGTGSHAPLPGSVWGFLPGLRSHWGPRGPAAPNQLHYEPLICSLLNTSFIPKCFFPGSAAFAACTN